MSFSLNANLPFLDTRYTEIQKSKIAELNLGKAGRKLIVSDVDSTFINQEVIDLLAQHAGMGDAVSAITEAAMRGELEFIESLTQRVATLAGQPVEIFERIQNQIELASGAEYLIESLAEQGHVFALISGGFNQVLQPIADNHNIPYYRANNLEITNGKITGKLTGPVVDAIAKAQYLQQLALQLQIPVENTIALGDGANDLEMMKIAGIAISFNGKPKVQAAADVHLAGPYLDHVLAFV